MGVLLQVEVLVGIEQVDQFAVLALQYLQRVIIHESNFDALVLAFSVHLLLQHSPLLLAQLGLAEVQEDLLIAAPARWEVAA